MIEDEDIIMIEDYEDYEEIEMDVDEFDYIEFDYIEFEE